MAVTWEAFGQRTFQLLSGGFIPRLEHKHMGFRRGGGGTNLWLKRVEAGSMTASVSNQTDND